MKNRRVDVIIFEGKAKKNITELIDELHESQQEKVRDLYFEGLDRYYKEDRKGAIGIWKSIKTGNRQLQEALKDKIKQVENE